MRERRSRERQNLIYYFRVLDRSSDQFLGYATDISTEGIRLICRKPTTPATAYHLRMILPVEIEGTNEVEFEATSRWCKRDGKPDYFESGFKLNNTRLNDLAIIERLCSPQTLDGGRKLTVKRVIDVLAASLGLLIISPFFLALGIAIKLNSPGSIFYIAKRVGRFGRPFRMYKFRTMTELSGSIGPRVTAHDDPRVTRIGHLLRKTKLNELPQLINVLKGEMSLVGPRPEYVEFIAHYSPEHREVLAVKPGITSLASIAYVDEENMLQFSDVTETYVRNILPDKLRLDLLYVSNQSLLLDIDILLQTITVLIPRFRKAAPRAEDIGIAPFRLARQYLPWFVVDAAIAFLAVGLATVMWRSASLFDVDPGRALIAATVMTALFSIANWITGVQRVYWRYASPTDAIGVVISGSAATILMLVANRIIPAPRFPSEMLIMAGIFAVGGFLIARYHRHLLKGLDSSTKRMLSASSAGRERVLIVGAGYAGQLTISLLRNNPAGRAFHVVGVVDDDLDLLGNLVHRAPVLGVCEQIPEIVRTHDVGTIVFAIHSIEERLRDHILGLCEETGARTVVAPDLMSNLSRKSPREATSQDVAKLNAGESQAAPISEQEFVDLQDQVRLLAEQARRGDLADVSRNLDRLEKALDIKGSANVAEPSDLLQTRFEFGDQQSP